MQFSKKQKILATSLPAIAIISLMSLNVLGLISTASPQLTTTTPIRHLVVIFQENVSFDHYFATYPYATNPASEPSFVAAPGTTSVNGLSGTLLTSNPNSVAPFRLDRTQAVTCDNDHEYLAEQLAYHGGLVDKFVENTGPTDPGCSASLTMGYYDGNTVTGMWNYAQNFALSDNSFETTFGPSTPGVLNLVSGQTAGMTPYNLDGVVVNGTGISDADPTYDDCSSGTTIAATGTNVGDLLNSAGVTWGWFQGGFTPSSSNSTSIVCNTSHTNIAGATVKDYSAHHEPFQYYNSTSNPHHLPPSSVSMIGYTDQANHQYDLSSFWAAVGNGNLPSVSFLKAPRSQDGHAGYSDPLDEQAFLATTINKLENSSYWSSTAIVIAYDDSDGWYDHVMPPIVSHSSDPNNDALLGSGLCGTPQPGAYQDRCGYGPRLPLLIISPWAKVNYVDHTTTNQASILKFIEDNWHLGLIGNPSFDATSGTLLNMFDFSAPHAQAIFLDPTSGEIQK